MSFTDLIDPIAVLLGRITGIGIGSAILTLIVAGFNSLRGKPLTKAQAWSVFVVAAILLVVMNFISICYKV